MHRGDEKKLKELLLYIAQKTADDPQCGAVKLNKILYHADFRAYLELGRPITGAPYAALEMGPGPYRLPVVRRELIEDGSATLDKELVGNYYQDRLVALRDPDLSAFRAGEIELVDRVIAELRNKGWKALSDATHATPGYIATDLGGIIPYESAWIARGVTNEERARAAESARQLGL